MHRSIEFGLSSYHYGDSVQFLATESGETSLEDVVLFSKAYPGVVCGVRSSYEWCGRRAAIPFVFSHSLSVIFF